MKTPLTSLLLAALALAAHGLTPAELRARLDAGERLTLIDLRPQADYDAGTLPDAMRMSLRDALQKPLKGTVVFFDDGTGPNLARRAAEQLAARNPDAQPHTLDGGYAAWRAAGAPTSERPGLSPALNRYLSYQDLTGSMTADAADVVLIDLRPAPPRAAASADATAPQQAAPPPVDLAAELPGFTVTRALPSGEPAPARQALGAPAPAAPASQPLYVLIDSGDGTAEHTARSLKASGVARVAILAGGETIIRRKGEPGLIRRGPGNGLEGQSAPDTSAFATVIEEEVKK